MEERKKEKKLTIVIIILLLIILALILFGISIGKIEHLIPTGNVDVFVIDHNFDDEDETKKASKSDKVESVEGKTWNTVIPDKKKNTKKEEQQDEEPDYEPGVKDPDGKWKNQNELHIFANPVYQMKSKIAPGVSNSYHFVVYNSSNRVLDYRMTVVEENPYNINMKYRLKRENTYVVGSSSSWVDISDLNISKDHLQINASDKYTLEWKWVDTSYDTSIGELNYADYKLIASITFEESEE